MKELLIRHKHFIAYAFFGLCTTVVNVLAYYICNSVFSIANVPSVVIAWIIAVVFAYFVNKVWVFGCKSFDLSCIIREFSAFISCRLLTGLIDVLIMYVAVDVLELLPVLWKTLSNIIVIILNYLAMRFFIFVKK